MQIGVKHDFIDFFINKAWTYVANEGRLQTTHYFTYAAASPTYHRQGLHQRGLHQHHSQHITVDSSTRWTSPVSFDRFFLQDTSSTTARPRHDDNKSASTWHHFSDD